MIFRKEMIANGKKRGCDDEQVREVKWEGKGDGSDNEGAQGEAKKFQSNSRRIRKLEEDWKKKKGRISGNIEKDKQKKSDWKKKRQKRKTKKKLPSDEAAI